MLKRYAIGVSLGLMVLIGASPVYLGVQHAPAVLAGLDTDDLVVRALDTEGRVEKFQKRFGDSYRRGKTKAK